MFLKIAEIKLFNTLIYSSRRYAHIHFENEAKASSFYHLYPNNSHILCRKFKDIVIKPSRENGVDVNYKQDDICLRQTRLDEHTFAWCSCLVPSGSSTVINTTDSNTNNARVSSASSNVNTAEEHNTSLK
ncbi:hypothetical protein PS6_011751 [Mucor atramentarius]